MSGTCEDVPTQCGEIYVPVCGCDGRNYGNHCKARQHAVSVRSLGECPSGPQEPWYPLLRMLLHLQRFFVTILTNVAALS